MKLSIRVVDLVPLGLVWGCIRVFELGETEVLAGLCIEEGGWGVALSFKNFFIILCVYCDLLPMLGWDLVVDWV